jgi:hypothetical protein
MPHRQKAGKYENQKPFENKIKFKFLGTKLTNQYCFQENKSIAD